MAKLSQIAKGTRARKELSFALLDGTEVTAALRPLDGDDHAVEESRGRLDDLDVAVVDGIERSRVQHHRHERSSGVCRPGSRSP